ncbi:unnamed protein product [Urochloa humidicola]
MTTSRGARLRLQARAAVRARPADLPPRALRQFATAVVELLLASLLLSFDWRAPHGGEVDLEEEDGLTVHRENPLVLVAERRRVASASSQ